MKTCTKCGIEKERSEFHARSANRDGLQGACKLCINVRSAASKRKVRATPEGRARNLDAVQQYYYTHRAAKLAHLTQYNKTRDPVKKRARNTLNNAVYYGRITKPDTCQQCGSGGRIHGHHPDYSKPLDVMWLCPPCHGIEHRTYDMEKSNETSQTNCRLTFGNAPYTASQR